MPNPDTRGAAAGLGSSPAHAIDIRGVEKRFGETRALAGVSLRVGLGEILGLLGPNGAGKTTLVRALMGRVIPDAGAISILGEARDGRSAGSRRELGWVPQEIALYGPLSARENLETFGRYQGLRRRDLRAAVERCLEWSALADRAREPVERLSGGMKRRLNMAAGIIHRPRILLLDEPTVGIDPQSRERIYQMIEQLHRDGISIIYTTHYMEEAERLCERIAIIDHGRIITEGTRDQLVRATLGNLRQVVVQCAAEIPAALGARLQPRGGVVSGSVLRLAVADPAVEIPDLLQMFRDAALTVTDLAMKTPALEQVFLHLTGRELRE